MACTRFNYDESRTKKKLQQSTDPGRWILNVPGNGDKPCYISDPQIISQKWGANLRTNTIQLESELFGIGPNKQYNRDYLANINNPSVTTEPIEYPTCDNLYTEQSRAIMPAWTARDLEQSNLYYLPLNPQENVCIPFQNNLSTRILEKDYFTPKYPCVSNENHYLLPVETMNNNKNNNLCTTSQSCYKVSK
jgi:hypothetical protein